MGRLIIVLILLGSVWLGGLSALIRMTDEMDDQADDLIQTR